MRLSMGVLLALLAAMLMTIDNAPVRATQAVSSTTTGQTDSTTANTTPKKKTSKKKAATDSANGSPAAAAAPATTHAPAKTAGSTSSGSAKASNPQQPANSSGMVWVNTDSGVYHKPGTRWYGKTKQGKYMSESDAQKAGYRAAAKE
jgi:hypothetical protein